MIRSIFIFKEHRAFIEREDNPSDKVVIIEESVDGIENLMDLPRLMFIDEECGNLKVVVNGRLLTRNINRKKGQTFYKPMDVHCATTAIDEIRVSLIFHVVTFFCE